MRSGLISSFQCWIKDDSRSIAYAGQTEYANHCMPLQSKVVVVNDAAKGCVQHGQVCVKKLNENKPLMKYRKGSSLVKSGFLIDHVFDCSG